MNPCINCGKKIVFLDTDGLCGDCYLCEKCNISFTDEEICHNHKCGKCKETCCSCSPEIEHSDEMCGDMYENCITTLRLCLLPGANGASKIIKNSRKYLCRECKFLLYAETLKINDELRKQK